MPSSLFRKTYPIFQLSEAGRAMTLKAWLKIGGCGLANNTMAPFTLGPKAKWPPTITLGAIEDACPYTGRTLAGFAVRELNRPDLAVPYVSPFAK